MLGYDNNEEAYGVLTVKVITIKEHNKNNFINKVEKNGECKKIDEEDYIILD